ncbi:hypothetical protein SapgrDRAFT_2846 [Saprospira grandis DSM 2844]|uniref:Secretion system C-terminal sorting domain-containing protein n=1 Tax=Saprospira grandis DSM 2844 TaxID=694433 RepID=J1I6R4_9BACT|nr:T9SS type A sorting domain-containing protein [Saprospira grandis]EJF54500.1 hypothetical protein SapgrDRAFT_2846 [Saprospira grandis DSM 2844]
MRYIYLFLCCFPFALYGQFLGGSGSGVDSSGIGGFTCSSFTSSSVNGGSGHAQAMIAAAVNCIQFTGDSSSGQSQAMLAAAVNCIQFTGDSLSGQSNAFMPAAINCLQFSGERASGAQYAYLDDGLSCPQFLASAAGGSGTYSRSYADDQGVCAVITLPIEASPLYAEKEDQKGRLHWQTFAEIACEGFEIQKSRDGLNWEALGWVAGQGYSQQTTSYEFWDEQLQPGIQYYRYKQEDFDGSFYYSNLVAIDYQEGALNPNVFTLYPNPSRTGTQINIDGWLNEDMTIELAAVNVLGQKIWSEKVPFTQGRYTYNLPAVFEAGNYWLLLSIPEKGFRKVLPFVVIQ